MPEINLECPVCFDLYTPPIYLCDNGHSICSCSPQLIECPLCRAAISNMRNFKLEEVVNDMDQVQKNTHICTSDNCKKSFLSRDSFERHKKFCEFREYQIDEIKFGKMLGGGAFGYVQEGFIGDNFKIAIKSFKNLPQRETNIEKELEILSKLNHPNIVNFRGIVKDYNLEGVLTASSLLIFDFYEYGSLESFIEIKRQSGLLLYISCDIASGMEYLHSMDILHRDLATRNILLDGQLKARIADFGLSHHVERKNYYSVGTQSTVPIRWYPKESLPTQGVKGRFSKSSDVWSFGCTLWEIWSQSVPFHHLEFENDVKLAILEEMTPISGVKNSRIPQSIWQIIFDIFKIDPNERPSFSALKEELSKLKMELNRDLLLVEDNPEVRESFELGPLLEMLIRVDEDIIAYLSGIIENILGHNLRCNIAKTAGTSLNTIGCGLITAGTIATLLSGGIVLPLLIGGVTTSVAGVATKTGTDITNAVIQKKAVSKLGFDNKLIKMREDILMVFKVSCAMIAEASRLKESGMTLEDAKNSVLESDFIKRARNDPDFVDKKIGERVILGKTCVAMGSLYSMLYQVAFCDDAAVLYTSSNAAINSVTRAASSTVGTGVAGIGIGIFFVTLDIVFLMRDWRHVPALVTNIENMKSNLAQEVIKFSKALKKIPQIK